MSLPLLYMVYGSSSSQHSFRVVAETTEDRTCSNVLLDKIKLLLVKEQSFACSDLMALGVLIWNPTKQIFSFCFYPQFSASISSWYSVFDLFHWLQFFITRLFSHSVLMFDSIFNSRTRFEDDTSRFNTAQKIHDLLLTLHPGERRTPLCAGYFRSLWLCVQTPVRSRIRRKGGCVVLERWCHRWRCRVVSS